MRRAEALILAGALLAAAGCGSDDEPTTPAACLGPASTYLAALEDAPGEVRLEGGIRISDCLVADQEAGPLGGVGEAIVGAATRLNREVRRGSDREKIARLGYLVGAVQRGASASGGIHADLVRRLDAAARFGGDDGAFSASFERAFGEGYAAGRERG